MHHLRYALFATLALLAILALAACSRSPSATDWHTGDSLVIRVKEMRRVEEVRYTDTDGKHYIIRPGQDDRQLAVGRLEVRTKEANVVYFSINKDALRLRDTKYLDYKAIDPFQQRQEVDGSGVAENTLLPFIWGDVEMPATCGEQRLYCELVGWVLFDVPRDIGFYQMIWDAADTIYMNF
ncbi:MAG: hypothetical protein HY531_01735 [Chloroflexi bacterium]|nr:hypothetical protein [Chloroflexota bacterium]